jgi:hypothetical protein
MFATNVTDPIKNISKLLSDPNPRPFKKTSVSTPVEIGPSVPVGKGYTPVERGPSVPVGKGYRSPKSNRD